MKRWGRFIILAILLLIVLAFYLMLGTKHKAGSQLPRGQNAEQTAEIAQALKPFGCMLTIPEGMAIAHKTQDFLWFTDNGTGIMRNICLYCYPAEALDTALVIQKRDSVMKQNMPGEEPQENRGKTSLEPSMGCRRNAPHRRLVGNGRRHDGRTFCLPQPPG